MKIFPAIQNAKIVRDFFEKTGVKLNVLISYQYLNGQANKLVKDYRDMINLLYLDSGAYTANKGKVRRIEEENRPFTTKVFFANCFECTIMKSLNFKRGNGTVDNC